MEKFKDIIGYEGYYQISNYGNVRSLNRMVKCKGGKFKLQKGKAKKCAVSNGYKLALLCKDGKEKGVGVHRLVGIYFINNPLNKPEINHKDANKLNNHYSNLEWVTRSENTQHAQDMGLQERKIGEKSHFAKLTDLQITEIFHLSWQGKTAKEITELYPVTYTSICRILRHETYSNVGLIKEGLAIDINTLKP